MTQITELRHETAPPDGVRVDDLLGCQELFDAYHASILAAADDYPEDEHGRQRVKAA